MQGWVREEVGFRFRMIPRPLVLGVLFGLIPGPMGLMDPVSRETWQPATCSSQLLACSLSHQQEVQRGVAARKPGGPGGWLPSRSPKLGVPGAVPSCLCPQVGKLTYLECWTWIWPSVLGTLCRRALCFGGVALCPSNLQLAESKCSAFKLWVMCRRTTVFCLVARLMDSALGMERYA